jgi:diguanylate cyclase (GGDEF)-like protein
LERESQEDSLTGIANRRHFDQRLTYEIGVARKTAQPLTLAVADLDHFKIVNDRLGHAVGDEVLRRTADIMRHQRRAVGLVARIGGEEFALVLTGMTLDVATNYCELLRRAFESNDWSSIHPDLHLTLSIGISQWDGSADPAAFLQAADVQLYQAKNAGRNRVA